MIHIVPKPYYCKEKDGFKTIDGDSKILVSNALKKDLSAIERLFAFIDKSHYTYSDCAQDGFDIQVLFDASHAKEQYSIECTPACLKITAGDASGLFYAAVSLRQMVYFQLDGQDSLKIPCFDLNDKPRFKYRGVQLDESRHFFGVDQVKRLLRLMALYKLNVLHWHLTDDQGWRIEIKKYPLLTEIGSKRKDTNIHGWQSADMTGEPYGGFYTQEQIRDIVSYAQKLHITIIPEIDMPAHFAAAMAAYHWLGCREIPCEVHWFFGGKVPETMNWTDWNRSACAGKESTYTFIFNVIDEVSELFPAKYFHIGGDEAPKDEWKKCPHCQKRMRENGLKNTEDLQGYFNNRIAAHLKEKGKTLIVWNEALKAQNLDGSVIGQYWTPKNDKNVRRELKKGRQMLISKHQAFYFDMCYCQYPLSNTYRFEPTEKIVPAQRENQILGLEGHLWTEWIGSIEKLDMQLFPRALALSEVCWSSKYDKDIQDFYLRLPYQEKILQHLGVNYARLEIAEPKNPLYRKKGVQKWYQCDQDFELRANEKLKNK